MMGYMRTPQEKAENRARFLEQIRQMLESGRCIVSVRNINGRKEITLSLI
jgi:hypothetical protein